MARILNDARAISAPQVTVEQTELAPEATEALRFARYCALEESIGLAFGIVTVVYIVQLLVSLNL